MSVYVDDLFETTPGSKWPYKQACHLSADSEEELHEFAKGLCLKRAWFQQHPTLSHYDLTTNKRLEALDMGAKYEHIMDTMRRLRQTRKEETDEKPI